MELGNSSANGSGAGAGLGWASAQWTVWGGRAVVGVILAFANARLAGLLFREPPSKSMRLLACLAVSDAAFCASMTLE